MIFVIPILKRSLNISPRMWCKQRYAVFRARQSRETSRQPSPLWAVSSGNRRMGAVQTFQILQDAIQIADNNRDCLAIAATNGYGVAAAALQSQYLYHLRTILFFSNNLRQWRRGLMLGKQRQTPLSNPKGFAGTVLLYAWTLCPF